MSRMSLSLACLVVLVGLHLPRTAVAQLTNDVLAPQKLGKTRGGEEVSLSDRYGRVQAVTFWASWCGPCMNELPLLEKLQRVMGPERLRVVAVCVASARWWM